MSGQRTVATRPWWLWWINFIVLQWITVRFALCYDTETGKRVGHAWLVGVVPLSGWWGAYWWLPFGRGFV